MRSLTHMLVSMMVSFVSKAQSALLSSPLPSSIFTLTLQLLTGFTGCPPSLGSCNADQCTSATGTWPSTSSPAIKATSACTADANLQLRRVFDMLDANGDGYVSADEMARQLGKLGLGEDKEAVREALVERRLDYEGLQRLCVGSGEEEEEEEVVEAAFAVFDEDGDGEIGVGELQRVMLRLGFTQCHDPDFCHRIIASLDPRLDDSIDLPHFRRMLLA